MFILKISMVDQLVETRPLEVMVGEPPMKGFMRSFANNLSFSSELEDWEKQEVIRKQVKVPLSKFAGWVKKIAPDFEITQGLTNENLGRVTPRDSESGKFITVIHDATQMEANGKDESEAKARLKETLVNQLQIWRAEGDLVSQVERAQIELLEELSNKYGIQL